jgi:hypothetical protein
MAQHKTFDVICAEAKVHPTLLPAFSRRTLSLPGGDARLDLSLIKDTVATLAPGAVSTFVSTAEGGLVVQLISKQPADDALVKAGLAEYTAQLRAGMKQQALRDWSVQLEKSTSVSLAPGLTRSRPGPN